MTLTAFALHLTTTVLVTSLAGCIPEPGPIGLDVRNETNRTLWIDTQPANEESPRGKLEPGEQTQVGTKQCTREAIEAQTRTGRAIAVLHEEWCPGQIWSVRGEDDASLTDVED